MSGTEVTATDLDTGESETVRIENDYLIITDGNRYLDGVQVYANGTAVVTIRRGDAPKETR